ncbi:MAG: hypothetical protein IJW22_05395, partial [Clostridia bacterium]|nr:hypothetical protein [Clostridia bacterium]
MKKLQPKMQISLDKRLKVYYNEYKASSPRPGDWLRVGTSNAVQNKKKVRACYERTLRKAGS